MYRKSFRKVARMKKTQLFIIFVMASFVCHGQFDSTRYVMGGTGSFYQGKNTWYPPSETSKSTAFSISPSIAKVLRRNSLLGVEVSISASHQKQNSLPKVTDQESSQGYGLYYRRFYEIAGNIYFSWEAKARIGFAHSNTDASGTTVKQHTTSYDLLATPAISWKVGKRLLLNGSVGNLTLGFDQSKYGNGHRVGVYLNKPNFGFIFLLN
jgi:hypothetical protein